MFKALIAAAMLSMAPQPDVPQLNENNIPEVIAAMTVEEKCALIIGGRAKDFNGIGFTSTGVEGAAGVINGIPRLGIPTVVLADGPAGLRISPTRKGDDRTFYCTGYPIATMLSSTWNLELVEQAGMSIGNEVLEYGVDVLLAPGVNIHRNPLCGRNFEYYSEDPLLAGKMAAAMINGIESNGVGTSMKHFAVNNQENNRLANNSIISERALREIYLKNFEIAVKESQPWTIMTSYNFINGEHASESSRLLTDILRGEWGFEGAVMTDWSGGYDDAQIVHAGNEMIQPGSDARFKNLLDAINDGSLAMKDVDRAVARILHLVVKTPKFKGYVPSNAPDLKSHANVCKTVADEGVVLLKNEKSALPVSREQEIALFGTTSYDFIAGGTGSGNVNRPYVVDLMTGLSNLGFRLEPEVDAFYKSYMADEAIRRKRIDGKNGWYIDRERAIEVIPEDLIEKAAETADAAMITIGREFGEGKDRDYYHSYCLSDREQELIDRVSKAFHAKGKKLTVILNVGGFVEMMSWQDKADAILLCWQPGQEGGNTVASVLCGEVNPSGHLPSTMSTEYKLEPTFDNFPQVHADKPYNYSFYRHFTDRKLPLHTVKNIDYTNYEEGIYVGYRYFNTYAPEAVAYPFGYGLSYTTFDFEDMKVVPVEDGWNVNVTVKNTGKAAGKDVVQLYVKAPKGKLDKPERELKAFAKTPMLAPGESCQLTMYVSKESLASFDEASDSWVVDNGTYTFVAAQDAMDNSLKVKIKVKDEYGEFVRTKVADGISHYLFEGRDEISGEMQTVNVLRVDLDNEKYKVVFAYGADSTSAVAMKHNAIAAINATYEPDACYIRVNGHNHSEVSIPAGHLRYWKHDGALVLDGDRNLSVVYGAAGHPASSEGGEAAIALYKSLEAPNVFSSSPMLINDYDPVGTKFVPSPLEKPIKEYQYEDYRRHQGVRHPRVAVGLTDDNDLLLVVVDGRWPTAVGMSAKELTLFLAKHFNPRWALNMDGGGSSTMYLKGYGAPGTDVLNYPTDNKKYDHYGQRRICTQILICPAE